MINVKRNRSSAPSQPPISTQPASKLSRLKTGFNMFTRSSKHTQAIHTSPPVPSPPSPREDRFSIMFLFRDPSGDNLDTFLHSDKLKMMHTGKTRAKSLFIQANDNHREESSKHVVSNAQTVSNDATDKRILTLHKHAFRRRNSMASSGSKNSSKHTFTPNRKNRDKTRPLPSPVSSQRGQRGYRRKPSQISTSSADESVGSGSLTAKEFAKEAGIDLRCSHSDEGEAQFTMDDSMLSRESVLLSTGARGMTFRSIGGKSSNSMKVKLNILDDNFWKKPGTEDEPLSPPLSPTSLGPAVFSSSPVSEGIRRSASTDVLTCLDASQATHRSSPLPKPTPQLKCNDIPLSSSYPNNNMNMSANSIHRFMNCTTIPGGTIPGALPITIPPPPKDDSIAEPPFLAHLRRVSMIPSADALAGTENCSPSQATPVSSKASVIRKGRFEIVLGGEEKDAEPSLNPREVTHHHHHHHHQQLLHEPISRKSGESERERVREWRRKGARQRTSSDAGSSCFDDRSELSVKLDGSSKD